MARRHDPFDLSRMAGHRPVGELVYGALRQAIARGVLRPGQKLLTADLSERMKVSRTPVREAIRRLESEGFARGAPWHSVVVADLPPADEMEEFYALRGALEGLVAYFAARRRPQRAAEALGPLLDRMDAAAKDDDRERFLDVQLDFYQRFVDLASSRRIQQVVSVISDAFMRAKPVSLEQPGRMRQSAHELRDVCRAIESGDPARAERLARRHSQRAYLAYRTVLTRRARAEEDGV